VRFLLDANLPRAAASAVRDAGHEVESIRETSLRSASDDLVFAHAVKTSATLISRDLDFANMQRFAATGTEGIVVLRLPDNTAAVAVAEVIARFLASGLLPHLSGRLAIVEPDRVRFRPALEGDDQHRGLG
jgi:predicted nuclease of predicted toxin-antitoxin system